MLDPEVLTQPEVAELLRVNVRTVQRMTADGRLVTIRGCGRPRYLRSMVLAVEGPVTEARRTVRELLDGR